MRVCLCMSVPVFMCVHVYVRVWREEACVCMLLCVCIHACKPAHGREREGLSCPPDCKDYEQCTLVSCCVAGLLILLVSDKI